MDGQCRINAQIVCEVRRIGDAGTEYYPLEKAGLVCLIRKTDGTERRADYSVIVENRAEEDFAGVIHFKTRTERENPKFFMPGYMYNRNTAEKPSSGRKAFPRIKMNPEGMPESEYWMTRADRLALPISIVYDCGHITAVSADPSIKRKCDDAKVRHCGFTCSINDGDCSSVGYTLGYENAPWLFVQTATVRDRKPIDKESAFELKAGDSFEFRLTVYSYDAADERDIYSAIEDCYFRYHEAPRNIAGMDSAKAVRLLSGAIRDYAWLADEHRYSGFVYDRQGGPAYNRIPSLSWTNGLAVAVPMLLAANTYDDKEARRQALIFIDETVKNYYNPASGFLYESTDEAGAPTVRGWWYNGMHSGGHSAYLNGQAVYYLLRAYSSEKTVRDTEHSGWLEMSRKVVSRMNRVMNGDYEYPFAMSEETGAGIEYDSMGGAWFLAASALYEAVSADRTYMDALLKSEEQYFNKFVKKAECYGGPLDTDKAVDSEGILAYIRAVRYLHELCGEEYLLDHLRDALSYEFTFKLGYNTPVEVRPLSEIGWSSCGGSITSTANPHIHPMSSTVIPEMRYYLNFRKDDYVESRMNDTKGWGLQTFNTFEGEYGYGKIGWMSERFCFCEGLLTEKYPDGEPASTWFALMPWASASVIEGLL